MLRKEFFVDTRFVVEPLRVTGRDQLDQVVISGRVFREQHEVVIGFSWSATSGMATAGGHVDFTAKNWLDAAFACFVMENNA